MLKVDGPCFRRGFLGLVVDCYGSRKIMKHMQMLFAIIAKVIMEFAVNILMSF
jgi:hypothetical protein